jgi:hypothetical protein
MNGTDPQKSTAGRLGNRKGPGGGMRPDERTKPGHHTKEKTSGDNGLHARCEKSPYPEG